MFRSYNNTIITSCTSLPTMEVQVLKVHAYQALIDVATQSDNMEEIKVTISKAMETVRDLSVGLKMSFGRNALQVGMRQIELDVCTDAIATFRLILQVLDGVLSNTVAWKAFCAEGSADGIEDGKTTRAISEHYIYVMKIKTQLAMVYSFTQMK